MRLIKQVLKRRKRLREIRKQFSEFRKLSEASPRFHLEWSDEYLYLDDNTNNLGFDRHYVYHTAWAARILAQYRPAVHVDISSYVYFNALVSAFIPIQFYDYRPAAITLSNLTSNAADLTNLHFPNESIQSLSCMHVVEHIGLGRYGDALDPDGDLRAMDELQRVLAPGGLLLFAVPITGKPRIRFNGCRLYSYQQIIESFPGLELLNFALVPDKAYKGGHLIECATEDDANRQKYGCGCFLFRKL